MTQTIRAPWHRESYDRFLSERLPQLLAERVPLVDYTAERAGEYSCDVRVTVGTEKPAALTFDIPACDEEGVFRFQDRNVVVVALASCERLDEAEVQCVGEQLLDWIADRLGEAPADLPWDEPLARAWLPIDEWIGEFLAGSGAPQYPPVGGAKTPTAQVLDEQNWLSRQTHLRRVVVDVAVDSQKLIAPGQQGRVCPVETPEGRNIGRVLSLSRGATIRQGRIEIADDSPAAALGLSASMIPLIEHSDPARCLMGANMMRQWVVPTAPEPALVRTGNEPDVEGFWCGWNLLTAFVSWGGDTHDDGIVVSESAIKRMALPHTLEVGDKLSNRHGTKGTIARVLPDEQMPHLPDGTPVELVFSFLGCHTRLNFGQILEAVLGRIARAKGEPILCPPFAGPSAGQIKAWLAEAGMDESGMETLTDGRDGPPLGRPSTVGYVYWGEAHHLSSQKIHASTGLARCNRQSWMEYYALRDIGAFETIAETYNLRSVDRPDAAELAARVAAGPVEQAPPPTPKFADLLRRLAVAGIRMELAGEKLTFGFARLEGAAMELACPIEHPWLAGAKLDAIGDCPELHAAPELAEANERMKRIVSGAAPAGLKDKARDQLARAVAAFLDRLLDGEHVRMGTRVMFSGRTVLAPGPEMAIDQIGLAEEIAWTLFAPLVARRLGGDREVKARGAKAAAVLDEVMAGSWVIFNRAPTMGPGSLLAFHPVRIPENVIRIPLLVCPILNADFDGDQGAVFLPVTEAGQREAGELLSVAGHVRRDPNLIRRLRPCWLINMWGLAEMSRSDLGRKQIADLLGREVRTPEGIVTEAWMTDAIADLLERKGVEKALEAMQELMRLAHATARASGASLSPFVGASFDRPPAPAAADPQAWSKRHAQSAERLASRTDYDSADLGPQLLAVKSGARGRVVEHLVTLLDGRSGRDPAGEPGRINRSLVEGYGPEDFFLAAATSRRAFGELAMSISEMGADRLRTGAPKAFTPLARAMRSDHPGVAFAQAAAIGEVDPLTDLDSRLFVGLKPL